MAVVRVDGYISARAAKPYPARVIANLRSVSPLAGLTPCPVSLDPCPAQLLTPLLRGPICGSLAELFQPLLDIACALANTLGVAAQGVVHLGQAATGVGAGAQ